MISGCLHRMTCPLPANVMLWRVDLDSGAADFRLEWLAPAEVARAKRIALPQNARRLLTSHMALRQVLAAALDRTPGSLMFTTGEFGKPRLVDDVLHFNLSRSGPEALIGVSPDFEIGIDIEVIRAVPEADAVARQHFTRAEHADWSRSRNETRDSKFLECWTRKEACVKALGTGLSVPLVSVDAGFADGRPAAGVTLGMDQLQVDICSMVPTDGTVAALALAAPGAVGWASGRLRSG